MRAAYGDSISVCLSFVLYGSRFTYEVSVMDKLSIYTVLSLGEWEVGSWILKGFSVKLRLEF